VEITQEQSRCFADFSDFDNFQFAESTVTHEPISEWTQEIVKTYMESSWRNVNFDPIISKIVKYRRVGKKCSYEFACIFKKDSDSREFNVHYTDLIRNTAYRQLLIKFNWNSRDHADIYSDDSDEWTDSSDKSRKCEGSWHMSKRRTSTALSQVPKRRRPTC
jgi:hypothetical protein